MNEDFEKIAEQCHNEWCMERKYALHVGDFLKTDGGCNWCNNNPCLYSIEEPGCAAGSWRRLIGLKYSELEAHEKALPRGMAERIMAAAK